MKPEINLPQGQVTLPPHKLQRCGGIPRMPPCSSLLKAGHGVRGVRSLTTALVLLHPPLLWSEAEAGREPERQEDDFLISLWHSSKSRCLRKKDIDLDPAHSPAL